ncbi:MAG TPA: NADH-quinone oxidoreductase subunit L [Frankiaceae bacterium]|nr:NADH-quinone oxidoreductase subunit L [Frankiaceae bacterium]
MTHVLAAPSVVHYASATGSFKLLWLLLLFPLIGAAVLLLGGKRTDKWGHYFAVAMAVISFVIGLILFFALKGRAGDTRSVDQHLFSWIPVNGFQVDAGLLLDQLSSVFVLLITGVGSLIHIYSLGYMAHDPGRRRFFAFLNLFLASMLLLVLGDSYLSLYVGWEMVGLSSYLLIQFWVHKPEAATAANKAFFFNRVGDVGLSIAIMLMFATVGSTSFASVFGAAGGSLTKDTMTGMGLLLLLGACGKSGQFPLQGWLPDAMEGPTPVSALIHAATMVTAGVYLIARSNPIFDGAPAARTVVLIIGVITLLYGCIIGCAYDDIKKVFAYSTVSQIGYMFVAVGLGPAGYALGILHLLAHGFFKAGLFLGAGSVMHAMNDTVDARRFGGLWKVMPITWVTTGLGYLAIIGCPPFSGFFTKDKIIEAAFDKGGTSGALVGTAALLGAGLTAFYMTRIFIMTFHGKRRWKPEFHPHESPRTMTGPMIILAVGSVFAGGLLVFGASLQNWLAPVLGKSAEEGVHTISPIVLTLLTLLVVVGGVAGGYLRYQIRPVPVLAPSQVTPVTRAARANLYTDAANEAIFMRPGQWLTRMLVFVDNNGIDGAVRSLAAGIGGLSGRLRRTQTGFVRSYALSMLGGVVLIAGALLLVRIG